MANKFWVGGTGTWDASGTAHWADTSNGSAGAVAPSSIDTANFDANSGGGTVTVNGDLTVGGIGAGGGWTGTLDFDANDNNTTVLGPVAFNDVSGGTGTIKLGNGNTLQCDAFSLSTNAGLVWTPGTCLIKCVTSGTPSTTLSINFNAAFSFPNVQVGPQTSWPVHGWAASTIQNLTLAGPVKMSGNVTVTVTGTLTVTATEKGKGVEARGAQGTQTWALTNPAEFHWSVLRNLNFSGAAARAYNSMNGGGCTNVTFSYPKYGRVIGG